jgi:hypothetical protein
MKVACFIFLIILRDVPAKKPVDNYREGLRFKGVTCTADNTTAVFKYCFVKAISRRIASLNIGMNFIKPWTKPIMVQYVTSFRYGMIYRPVLDTKEREWCALMSGHDTHPLFTMMMVLIKGTAPKLFHNCPYEGHHDLRNITVDDSKRPAVFPNGHYKAELSAMKGKTLVLHVVIGFEIKSNILDSFGRK